MAYVELTLTSRAAGTVFYSYYDNPVDGSQPDDTHWDTFKPVLLLQVEGQNNAANNEP